MKDAEALIERILYLDGVPNLQRLGPVRVGETVPEQFDLDLDVRGRRHRALQPRHRCSPSRRATTAPASCSNDACWARRARRLAREPDRADPPGRARELPRDPDPRLIGPFMATADFEPSTASPTFDRRPWGTYAVLDDGDDCKVKRMTVDPGQRLSYQSHAHRAEHWVVVRGVATVTLDGTDHTVEPGRSIDIPLGAAHRVANHGVGPARLHRGPARRLLRRGRHRPLLRRLRPGGVGRTFAASLSRRLGACGTRRGGRRCRSRRDRISASSASTRMSGRPRPCSCSRRAGSSGAGMVVRSSGEKPVPWSTTSTSI